MIKNDVWIKEMSAKGMIKPFEGTLVRKRLDSSVLSYGTSSFGYDLRLSPKEFKVFRHIPGTVVDPKKFNPDNLESVPLLSDHYGDFFILPKQSYGLGVSFERVSMPANVTAVCIGKSTMARCGIIANVTPIEPMFHGYITLEFSNSSHADCRLYANEGIVQLLFLEGEPCKITYEDRKGKYQGQEHKITMARV